MRRQFCFSRFAARAQHTAELASAKLVCLTISLITLHTAIHPPSAALISADYMPRQEFFLSAVDAAAHYVAALFERESSYCPLFRLDTPADIRGASSHGARSSKDCPRGSAVQCAGGCRGYIWR